MASVAATPKRRRGGRRIIVALVILVLIVVGIVVWLNVAAQAQVNASGTLTVYQAAASVSHNGTDFASALTGSVVQPGDSVKTDTKGRAAITLPDGTLTRLASDTTLKLDSAHFTKTGNLHDVTLSQQIGRTFTNVQHLATGATFNVKGKSATASVRGTKFEVLITADDKMTVKLFEGTLDFIGKNTVHLKAGQQATADANGNIGDPTPIVAVASVESCASADIEQNHAVHRGYTAHDLVDAVQQSGQVSGLSNLKLSLSENSAAGAIVNGSGTYNGVGWSGSVVMAAHNGVLDIMPTGGSVFGMSVPAQQVVQQIAAAIGQDPSHVSPGVIVDRLLTCKSASIVDGRMR